MRCPNDRDSFVVQGYLVLHAPPLEATHSESMLCWCGPFLIAPTDPRTENEIADAITIWEMGH